MKNEKNMFGVTLEVLFFVFILFFSCNFSEEKKSIEKSTEDLGMLQAFLLKHKKSVIELNYFDQDSSIDSIYSVEEFINVLDSINLKKSLFEKALLQKAGLDFIENNDHFFEGRQGEFIRVLKGTFAFGYNQYRLIQIEEIADNLICKDFLFKIDGDCVPIFMERDSSFLSDCISIVESESLLFGQEDWKKIKSIINETDLTSTVYFDHQGLICGGFGYELDFSYELKYPEEMVSLAKSCPGEKTAIYLVSEEVINIVDKLKNN